MFIAPTPRLVNGVLEVAFFVISTQGMLFDGDAVFEAVEENEEELIQTVSDCCCYVIILYNSSVFLQCIVHKFNTCSLYSPTAGFMFGLCV